MRYFAIISLFAVFTTAYATVNGRCTGRAGVCVSTSNCAAAGGTYVSGACPNDPSNIKCCNKSPCYNNNGSCKFTSDCSSPAYYTVAGHCPGGSNFQCCVPSGCVVCKAGEKRDSDSQLIPCC